MRGVLPRTPRAVLFDVYGTILIDTRKRPDLDRTSGRKLARIIRRHGLGIEPEELTVSLERAIAEQRSALRSGGTDHPEIRIEGVWGSLFPGRSPEELKRLALAYELAVHPVRPMPACRKLFGSLSRRGLFLGIVSNAQFYTPLQLHALLGGGPEELGFSPLLCIYSFEHGAAKPQNTLFELAAGRLERLGIERAQAVMVGNDRENDLVPAARCGFMTVLLSAGGRTCGPQRSAVSGGPPDAVIGRLSDLEILLERVPRSC